MFNLSILFVFGLILNANSHLLNNWLHNIHAKHNSNRAHHGIFPHSGAGYFPQMAPPPPFGHHGPPPFGFPPHHNYQHHPSGFSHPNHGQLPYPPFNPIPEPNSQPTTQINTPSTININNINTNSQHDATSISSAPTNVNVNSNPTASNVPIGFNGANQATNGVTSSQFIHDGKQQLNPSNAAPSGLQTNNNNAYADATSQNSLNQFGSSFGSNLNNLATSNEQTNLNAQTTALNAQTTSLNAQTTNFNANSNNNNNVLTDMSNQYGIDMNSFNAINNILNGAAVNPLPNNMNNMNNNPQTVPQPPTAPTYTTLPPIIIGSTATYRDEMEYDIDVRFLDDKNESKLILSN